MSSKVVSSRDHRRVRDVLQLCLLINFGGVLVFGGGGGGVGGDSGVLVVFAIRALKLLSTRTLGSHALLSSTSSAISSSRLSLSALLFLRFDIS
ncbi:hypothetical protein CPB83DRAFT_844008, partial [Crepidotus variabilis]